MEKYKPINGWNYETIKKHLEENFKGKAILGGCCRYRAGDLKCVAGCFLSDEIYDETMENTNIAALIKKYKLFNIFPLSTDEMLMWQSKHDDYLNSYLSLEDQIAVLMQYIEE